VDSSIFKLYDYFEENPDLGNLPESVLQLQVWSVLLFATAHWVGYLGPYA
jgi:hypothetical protein